MQFWPVLKTLAGGHHRPARVCLGTPFECALSRTGDSRSRTNAGSCRRIDRTDRAQPGCDCEPKLYVGIADRVVFTQPYAESREGPAGSTADRSHCWRRFRFECSLRCGGLNCSQRSAFGSPASASAIGTEFFPVIGRHGLPTIAALFLALLHSLKCDGASVRGCLQRLQRDSNAVDRPVT